MSLDFDPATLRLVVFDFDGVILESAGIKTVAFPELFAEYPRHQAAIRDYHLAHQGVSRFKKFEWVYRELLRQPLDEAESQRLGDGFTRLVLQKVLTAPFVPGALELLRHLHGRLPLAVASGTPQGELRHIASERGISRYFLEIAGTPRSKTEILRGLIAQLAITPAEVLMVGDASTDYEAAHTVGCSFYARHVSGSDTDWAHGSCGGSDLLPLSQAFLEISL